MQILHISYAKTCCSQLWRRRGNIWSTITKLVLIYCVDFFQHELPTITQNVKSASTITETVTAFWKVDDMFTFDNIGFSNTVGTTKYLACADCDAGPVGYHDLNTKISYVALCRIEYV